MQNKQITAQLIANAFNCAVVLSFSFRVGFADGDVGVAAFFLEATAEVIVTAVYGAGSAGALHKVMPVFGFDLVATEVTANSIFDNHFFFLLWGSSP